MMTWTRMESLVLKTITVDLQERDRERERETGTNEATYDRHNIN